MWISTHKLLINLQFAIVYCSPPLYLSVEGKVGFGGSEQEWGYVTVRPGAHMFWWLYYTTSKEVTNVYEKPLLIWLSCDMKDSSSSGYGNFKVVGPLDSDLQPRNFSWVTMRKKKIGTSPNSQTFESF